MRRHQGAMAPAGPAMRGSRLCARVRHGIRHGVTRHRMSPWGAYPLRSALLWEFAPKAQIARYLVQSVYGNSRLAIHKINVNRQWARLSGHFGRACRAGAGVRVRRRVHPVAICNRGPRPITCVGTRSRRTRSLPYRHAATAQNRISNKEHLHGKTERQRQGTGLSGG